MASIFRRLRREKEDEPAAEAKPVPAKPTPKKPAAAPPKPTPAQRPAAPAPVDSAAPSPPAGPATEGGTKRVEPDAEPAGPPPPLPLEDLSTSRSGPDGRSASVRCFVCGTAMDGPWCPTCRMVWNE